MLKNFTKEKEENMLVLYLLWPEMLKLSPISEDIKESSSTWQGISSSSLNEDIKAWCDYQLRIKVFSVLSFALSPRHFNALSCLLWSPCCSSFTHFDVDSDSRPGDRPGTTTLHFISKLLLLAPHLLWKFVRRGNGMKWNIFTSETRLI